jgi:hypothetical protein
MQLIGEVARNKLAHYYMWNTNLHLITFMVCSWLEFQMWNSNLNSENNPVESQSSICLLKQFFKILLT